MRAFITAILLFALILGGIILSSCYVKSTCNSMKMLASDLSNAEKSEVAFSSLSSYWQNHKDLLRFTVSEQKTQEMNELIASISSAIAKGDAVELKRLCTLIYDLSDDIALYEGLSFESIL